MASSSPTEYEIDSETYKHIFKNNRKKLIRSIDPTDTLIHSISESDIQPLAGKLDEIRSKPTTEAKVLVILSILIGENPETIKRFIILKDNDHKHVADVFILNSSEHLMSDERYGVLNSKLTALQRYLDP